mgnify:CR=1 FL=1
MSLYPNPWAPKGPSLGAVPSVTAITPQSLNTPPPVGPRAPDPRDQIGQVVPCPDKYLYAIQQPAEVYGQDSLRYDIM